MNSKIKNIIILVAVGALLVLAYVFFVKKSPEERNLVASAPTGAALPSADVLDKNSQIARDFLSLLLSVKSIKLDDTIFSDLAFISLRDSSITLTPTGDEGRINPFAPIGSDSISVPTTLPPVAPALPPAQ